MPMTAAGAFVSTLDDLAHRSRPDGDAYDLAQTAGLLRRLLLDGGRLVDIVNREVRLDIRLEWTPQWELGVSRFWIASKVLDPDAAEKHVYRPVPDDPDHYTLESHVPPVIVNRYNRLLDHDAIVTEGHNVTVGQVLSHYANQLGGVHWGPTEGSPPRLLRLAVKYEEPLVREAILAVARVVVRGLQPLLKVLAGQPVFSEPAEIPEHIRNIDNGTGPIPGDSWLRAGDGIA